MALVIPGYAEAVKRENEIRDASFLGIEERINGVEVKPFTLRHMNALDSMRSPFLLDRKIGMEIATPQDVAIFLWNVSPQFRVIRTGWDVFTHYRFIRSLRRLKFDETCKAIFDYVEEAFQDSPAGSSRKSMPFASYVAHIIDWIASTYHWDDDDILDKPLKRIFQYIRCIQRRTDGKAMFFNASDKIRGDFLRQLNTQN